MRQRLEQIAKASDPTPLSSNCVVCDDRGFVQVGVGVTRCECQKQKIIREKLSQIPERFRTASFANYSPTDNRQAQALALISGEFTGSYFLYGDYAHGKTHLATAQYAKLVQIERSCLFLTMGELISELRRAEMDGDYFCLVRQRARYMERFHLFIDDIDKFKVTEFKFEVLFDLIDTMYKRNLGLTVTSNYSLRELSNSGYLHPSVVRRLDDICKAVEV
jgi:DNA replication protein DnaC